mmetsp:Transcript_5868/g.17530  ORF Transcript_5868/g.17530 Transcript_5868/m.17530 type:complete len:286 (-) Transcript_5868:157-1014(-)
MARFVRRIAARASEKTTRAWPRRRSAAHLVLNRAASKAADVAASTRAVRARASATAPSRRCSAACNEASTVSIEANRALQAAERACHRPRARRSLSRRLDAKSVSRRLTSFVREPPTAAKCSREGSSFWEAATRGGVGGSPRRETPGDGGKASFWPWKGLVPPRRAYKSSRTSVLRGVVCAGTAAVCAVSGLILSRVWAKRAAVASETLDARDAASCVSAGVWRSSLRASSSSNASAKASVVVDAAHFCVADAWSERSWTLFAAVPSSKWSMAPSFVRRRPACHS